MFVTYRLIVLLIPQNRNSFSAIPMQHCSNMKSGTLSVEQAVNTILFQAICASKNRARNKRCALCRQCSKYGNMRNTRVVRYVGSVQSTAICGIRGPTF